MDSTQLVTQVSAPTLVRGSVGRETMPESSESQVAEAPQVEVTGKPQAPAEEPKETTQTATSAAELREAVEALNAKAETMKARSLEFHVDDDSGRTVVKVLDKETGEVIREIPPEDALGLADGLSRLMEGDEAGFVLSMEL